MIKDIFDLAGRLISIMITINQKTSWKSSFFITTLISLAKLSPPIIESLLEV